MKRMCDTQGYITNCVGYDPCQLCYGCRNYGLFQEKCYSRCGHNQYTAKNNVCFKKEIHNERNFEKMITRPYIDLDQFMEGNNVSNN